MIDFILKELRRDENYHGQVVRIFELEKSELPSASIPLELHPVLTDYFKRKGISKLYSHQIEAIKSIKRGENIIITTSTSSGKTIAFNTPIIDHLLKNPGATALYIYPTKALTQDQFEKINEIIDGAKLITGIYDGDTSLDTRAYLRRNAKMILANPDMLHVGILPNHMNWGKFFSNLQFIVIDEAHYYGGILGSHMSEIMRRLRRISHYYGAYPQFILASATLENPEEFSFRLIGERVKLIGGTEYFPARKSFIIFNPPVIDGATNLRKSIYREALWVLKTLFKNNVKTIAFVKSRRGVELLSRLLLNSVSPEERELISSYRAGYTKETRNEIEKKIKNDKIRMVVTTNALELGIDIGDIDASIIVGYPGSLSSIFQQSGRSGRKSESITIFITGSNPLDQYFVRDPEYIFSKHVESITVNPENSYIETPHMKCAAYELPLEVDRDVEYFGSSAKDIVNKLEDEGVLTKKGERFFYLEKKSPAPNINIRGTGEENIELIDTSNDQVLETISWERAIEEAFEGAVYLHLGDTYLVTKLDLDKKFALLVKREVDFYTDSLAIETIWIRNILEEKWFDRIPIYYGDVLVNEKVRGFVKKQIETDRRIGTEELDLPEIKFVTKALWFTLNEELCKKIIDAKEDIPGTIHATEHLLVAMMPLVVVCERNDVGGVSHPLHPDTQKTTIFIYDGVEGGIGLSEKGFERIEELLNAAYLTVKDCPCNDGCPGCIFSPKCGNENNPLSKRGAQILLKELLE